VEVYIVETSLGVSIGEASVEIYSFCGLEINGQGYSMVVDGVVNIVVVRPNLGRETGAGSPIEETEPIVCCGLFMVEVVGEGEINLLNRRPP